MALTQRQKNAQDSSNSRADEVAGGFAAAAVAIGSVLSLFAVGGLTQAFAIAQINAVLLRLSSEAATWAHVTVPAAFAGGVREFGVEVTADHRDPAQALADALSTDLQGATHSMGLTARKELFAMTSKRLLEGVAGRLEDRVRDTNVKVLDSSKREWDPVAYVKMAVSWHLHHALNTGKVYAAHTLGAPGVLVSDGSSPKSDEACLKADGQRWSLAYASAHTLEHPGCVRKFSAIPRSSSEALDRS